MDLDLHNTRCAICNTEGNSTEIYPANFDAFNMNVFSARRLPDQIHYRIVKCNRCGLFRSDPIAEPGALAELYKQSSFDYGDEIPNIKHTYGTYLSKLIDYGVSKNTLLEIGCGNGFFLEEAISQGYQDVRGIEPSSDAITKATPAIRSKIICDMMKPGLFEANLFDVICLFQVLDHLPSPNDLLRECFRILKPGGLFLCLNHNVEALSARFLKERSPIIDIEHTFLYSPTTMTQIFKAAGFLVMETDLVYNTYSIHYLSRLLPLPASLKNRVLNVLKNSFLGHIRLSVPLGNLYLIAQKPPLP